MLQKLQTLLKKSNIGKYFLTKTRLSHKDSDDLAKYIVDHLLQKKLQVSFIFIFIYFHLNRKILSSVIFEFLYYHQNY